jgi:hypothetical protein
VVLVFPGMAGRAVGCAAMLIKQEDAQSPFLGPSGWQTGEYRWLSGPVRNDGHDLIVPLEDPVTRLVADVARLSVVLIYAAIEGTTAPAELAVATDHAPPPPSFAAALPVPVPVPPPPSRGGSSPPPPRLRQVAPAMALLALAAVGGIGAGLKYESSRPAPTAFAGSTVERAVPVAPSWSPPSPVLPIAARPRGPAPLPAASSDTPPPPAAATPAPLQAVEPEQSPAPLEPAPPPPAIGEVAALPPPAATPAPLRALDPEQPPPAPREAAPPEPAPPPPARGETAALPPSLPHAPVASPGSTAFQRGVGALRKGDRAGADRAFDEAGRDACDYFDVAAKLFDPNASRIKREFAPDGLKALQYYLKARTDPSCREEAETRIRDVVEWAQGQDARAVLRWWNEHR